MKKFLFAIAALFAATVGAYAQPAPSFFPGCVYNSTPPTLSDKQTTAIQCDSSGRVKTTGGGGASGLVVGTTTITGGTTGRILYDNAGVVGEYATVPVANGGTNLSSGTSGGILGFTASGTIASSGALTANAPVLGGGAGATPSTSTTFTTDGAGQITATGASASSPGFYSMITGDTNARIAIGTNASDTARVSMGPGNAVRDLFLRRAAGAKLALGTDDVDTAPVAQTLSVQNTLAGGTSNVAGANWTFDASQGKGTGVGGSIIFRTAPAGSTGTAVNALATVLTLTGAGQGQFAADIGIGAAPRTAVANETTINLRDVATFQGYSSRTLDILQNSYYDGSNYKAIATGTSTRLNFGAGGSFDWYTGPSVSAGATVTFANILSLATTGNLSLVTAAGLFWSTDLSLYRDAANTLAQYNSTASQTNRLYGSRTDGSNGDWLESSKAASGAAYIRTVKNGTGTASTLSLGVAGTNYVTINTSGASVFSGAIASGGTVPSLALAGGTCAGTVIAGGSTAGTVTLTGVCVATNTMTLSAMPTAPTGYVCDAADRTLGSVALNQTSTSTTTSVFTFSATTGATDVIVYKCIAY